MEDILGMVGNPAEVLAVVLTFETLGVVTFEMGVVTSDKFDGDVARMSFIVSDWLP